jgi:hypothetical protein
VGFDCPSVAPKSCIAEVIAKGVETGQLPPVVIPFQPQTLGVGLVGPHGTVIRGEDLKDFNFV